MKLAVTVDPEGRILGLAVCRILFPETGDTSEISIEITPVAGGDADQPSLHTHLIELPADLASASEQELADALARIAETKCLDLAEREPCLRDIACPG